jgi:hypothetical protein
VTQSPRQLGESGLTSAIDRLSVVVRQDVTEFLIPCCECLFWISALYGIHRPKPKRGAPSLLPLDSNTPAGRTLLASVYVRTFVGHQLLSAALINYGASGFQGVGFSGMMLMGTGTPPPVWIGEPDLPSRSGHVDVRRSMYADHMAGRPVLDPLVVTLDYLKSL